ncbi:MAG: hypothetical protein ABI620_00140 [Chloroflexota bacterium]
MLSDADRARIEALPFDAAATPAWNDITACLVWPDEVPGGLTPHGYDYVRDLLGARGFIHRAVAIEDWDRGWTDRVDRWNEALRAGLRWNGFQRIALTAEQRALLELRLHDESIP